GGALEMKNWLRFLVLALPDESRRRDDHSGRLDITGPITEGRVLINRDCSAIADCRKRRVRVAPDVQAIFCRRRHQPRSPPLASCRLYVALMSVVVPSTVMIRDCQTGGENERLGAGAYHGSRRRLRHSISAVGPKIPSTKAVKGRSLSPAHNTSSVKGGYHVPFRH